MPEVTTRRAWTLLALSALLALAGCGGPAELSLAPGQWDFGTIPSTVPVEQNIEVSNPARRATEVRLISTCECLTIEPDAFAVAAGGSASVLVRYDPSEDEGDISMQVIVRSAAGRRSGRQVLLASGRVLPGAAPGPAGAEALGAADPTLRAASTPPPQFLFQYYYDPGCKGCEVLLVRQMVSAQQALGIRLRAERHHISEAQVHDEYLRRLRSLEVEERAYPALVFGDTVLQGDEEIEGRCQQVLRAALEGAGR